MFCTVFPYKSNSLSSRLSGHSHVFDEAKCLTQCCSIAQLKYLALLSYSNADYTVQQQLEKETFPQALFIFIWPVTMRRFEVSL